MTRNPTILLVDDDAAFRGVMQAELERMAFAVSAASTGREGVRLAEALHPEVVLLDLRLPDANGLDILEALRASAPASDVIMMTGHGSIDTAIESVRAGAFDYISKPCPLDELEVRIRRALERQSLRSRASLLERGLTPPDPGDGFVGRTAVYRQMIGLIERAAPSDSTVLILGETGTGKEMVAKLLHARSRRRKRPFVVVECAALQESLLQSELFGHERGAFTGAEKAKPGLFEVAHGGTLFLDEIGEVSLATQVKLLRVLDTATFRHVGGTQEIHVDVRILAATNRDLGAMVRQGLFREDLYYRLRTLTISVPPLRDRLEDIDLLADHFVARFNQRFAVARRLGDEARALLRRHTWPGNVRELLHAIEAAIVVCDGTEIAAEHFPVLLARQASSTGSGQAPSTGSGQAPSTGSGQGTAAPPSTLRQAERDHIAQALHASEGRRAQAARLLGISERNLYRKIRAHGLDRETT